MDSIRGQYHSAFNSIISLFQEKTLSGGGLSPMALDASDAPFNNKVIHPTTSDFICDVELAARRSLSSEELAYFNRYYKGVLFVVSETDCEEYDNALQSHIKSFPQTMRKAIGKLDSLVRERLGKALIDAGITPLRLYLSPVDVRGLA